MTNTTVAWTPVTSDFGAEVDADLSDEITASAGKELRDLLDARQLLVFRNQNLDYETQRRVVSVVGNPLVELKYISTEHGPLGDPLDEPKASYPSTTMFHSDLAFMNEGPLEGISLYAEDVSGRTSPGFQGTCYTSARNAYLNMQPADRAELDGSTAIQLTVVGLEPEQQIALKQAPFPEVCEKVSYWTEHPLFYTNRRTGAPVILYFPWFTHSIVGMSPEESQRWFANFDRLLYEDQEIYTHRWKDGDLLIWDNTALQHCKESVEEFDGLVPKRVLRRCSFGPEERNVRTG